MKGNEVLRKEILKVVNNQLRANKPPETKLTYNRLRKLGYDDFTAKQFIGQCVIVEIYDVLKEGKEYDVKRYVNNLNQLPKPPFEDE